MQSAPIANTEFTFVWDMSHAVLNDALIVRACLWLSIRAVLYASIKQVNLSASDKRCGFKYKLAESRSYICLSSPPFLSPNTLPSPPIHSIKESFRTRG